MSALPDPQRNRRNVGLALYLVAQIIGGALLLLLFLVPALLEGGAAIEGLCFAVVLALPAGTLYLTVPRLLDRYDPEPWYALIGCLLWGGIAACGFSAVINSTVAGLGHAMGDPQTGDILSAVVSAPIVEEFFKGMGVFGVFYFLRREFDGVVDGIIYAVFVALGFATIENVVYYANAAHEGMLEVTFVMRGILFPWGHPVYTSMIGIGFGLARETEKPWVRWAAPFAGYVGAVLLHAIWNGTATLADLLGEEGVMLFLCMLPIWFLFVVTFIVLIVVLVRRRGRIIREFLQDEVALQNLTQAEVELVASAFGLFKARMRYGRLGADFVRAAARLALSKWHTMRAQKSQTHTFSMEFIVPLRRRLASLREELHRSGR